MREIAIYDRESCPGCGSRVDVIGADPFELTPEEQKKGREEEVSNGVLDAFRQLTPRLILFGVVIGGSSAVGAWLVHRYILPR